MNAINLNNPTAGFYAMKLTRGGPEVAVRIFFGFTKEPGTFHFLDRSPRWQAVVNGKQVDLDTAWPWCARKRISRAMYRYMLQLGAWARRYAPDHPAANPTKPIDLAKTPIMEV